MHAYTYIHTYRTYPFNVILLMHRSIFRIFVNIAHHKEAQIIAVYLQTIRTENLECVATNTSDLLYVCMYECIYMCVCVCVYVYICVCMCVRMCMCVCIYMRMCVCMCMYVLVCVYVSALVYVYMCVYV